MVSGVPAVVGEDGIARCPWGAGDPVNTAYHDTEWGMRVSGEAAHLERLNPLDSTRYLIEVRLPEDSLQPSPEDVALQQLDVVTIYGEEEMRAERTVSIGGWVMNPGEYPYRLGMTIKDLVLQAGGLRDGALLDFAEIARLPTDRSGGTLATVTRVPLDSSYIFVAESETYPLLPGTPAPAQTAPDFLLAPFDHVLVLRQP